MQNTMSKKTRELSDQLKSQPCADCKRTFDPICMDFDHRPDELKIAHVSQLHGNEEKFLAEVKKCDVVCACCHRLRTQARGVPAERAQKIRAAWTPERRFKQAQIQREVQNRPDLRERNVRTQRTLQNDPVLTARRVTKWKETTSSAESAARIRYGHEQARSKKSDSMKKFWATKRGHIQ